MPSTPSLYRPKKVEDADKEKTNLARTLAERCVAGEFEGVAYRAVFAPEAVELGINHMHIQYYIDKIDPADAHIRVADRLRLQHETAQAEEQGLRVVVVAGRGGGSVRALEKKLDEQAQRESKKRTRDSEVVVTLAQTQAELEQATAENAKLKAELHESREREAKRLREGEETARRIEKLEAEVAKFKGRASEAEARAAAKAEALSEARADARRKADTLQHSLKRAEERAAKMREAAGSRPSSSSGPAPYTEAEIEEFKSTIGDLEAQVRALKKENKADAAELERLSKAVANFGGKYKELSSARAAKETLEHKVAILEAENERLRARFWPDAPGAAQRVPLFDIARDRTAHGASYDEFFANVIAPAMLDTGASPEQINAIVRKRNPTLF